MEPKSIIEQYIQSNYIIGEQSGGSGHLASTDYHISGFRVQQIDGLHEIMADFVISISTEFTYYPDNPPSETRYKVRLLANNEGEIVKSEIISSENDHEIPDLSG